MWGRALLPVIWDHSRIVTQAASSRFDIIVVGAGIAGASIAAQCAAHGSVLLIEAEDQPGYHATGRSVAFWAETYGGPGVQPLTSASGPTLAQPDPAFSERGFLSPRGALHIGRADDAPRRADMVASFADAGVRFHSVDGDDLRRIVPGLRTEYAIGLSEPSTADIDVAALHGAYLAVVKRAGGVLMTRAALRAARRDPRGWQVDTAAGSFSGDILVNAAGAWADDVARMAGVRPLGIAPLRRTVVQLRCTPGAPDDMPVIMDLALNFYFKPVGQGRIWLSPHDETPDMARDVAPEDMDVAIAIDRLEHVVDWKVAAVERKWAGLRSFAPDRLPVYGFDADMPGFFWFAGQGGFGIQTSPAAAQVGAALLGMPGAGVPAGVDAALYAPGRAALKG